MKTCIECGDPSGRRVVCQPCGYIRHVYQQRAHASVFTAIRHGALASTRKTAISCADCGERATGYDHRDYLKPLDVAPVCRECNRKRGPALPLIARAA